MNEPDRADSATVRLTRVERAIAERLSRSRATIPDFTLECELDVTELMASRARSTIESAPSPTVNDVILHACARALRDHHRLRGRLLGNQLDIEPDVNIGVAVATDRGLFVPVVRRADELSLLDLSARVRALAASARSGALRSADLIGATMSVTNLGMFGVTRFQPVIDPDHAAIVAVGAVRAELALADGIVVERRVLSIVLSADHRIIDGVAGARFLADVKRHVTATVPLD